MRESQHSALFFLPKHASISVQRRVPILRQFGEKEIEHDDRQETFDKAFRARSPHAACARAAGEAFETGDQTNRPSKKSALEDAFKNLPMLHAMPAVLPILRVG